LIAYFKHFATDTHQNSYTALHTTDGDTLTSTTSSAGYAQQTQNQIDGSIGNHAQNPHQDDQPHNFTNSTPDVRELYTILKNMRSNASPGPDGLNAAFFKSAWP
jgi:hypothetical protein